MKHYPTLTRAQHRSKQSGIVLVTSIIFLIVLSMLTIMALRKSLFEERMAGNDRDTYFAREAAELALRDAERDIAGQRFDAAYCTTANKATCHNNLRPANNRPVSAADAGNFWTAANPQYPSIGLITVTDTTTRAAVDGTENGVYTRDATTACGMPLWRAADWDKDDPDVKCTGAGAPDGIVRTTIYGEFTGAPNTFGPNARLPRYLIEILDASDMGVATSSKVYFRITAVGFGRLGNFGGGLTSVTLQSIYSPL